MPKLEVKANGKTRTVSFDGRTVTLGRSTDNDVVLADKVASRRHCVIEQKGGVFHLQDLESHNGTWIGENRILEARLGFGETFRVGGTLIRLLPEEVEGGDSPPVSSARGSKRRSKKLPVAEAVSEEVEDLPRGSLDRSHVSSALTARSLVAGPLSKQLAGLMQACVSVPMPDRAPQAATDVRLLNKKAEPISVDDEQAGGGKKPKQRTRPAEALAALRQMMFVAFRSRATDIHIEPKPDLYSLRFRIDGLLHSVGDINPKMAVAILNVIKILCQVDISKKSVVQEGSFCVELTDRRVDLRVSLTPTLHGQKLALRLLDKAAVPDQFENLGMDLDAVAELTRICQQDAGMIILSGPTGSGKTTTLYTALQTLDAKTRNIVTVEDPVEYELENTTQISIDPTHGLTFASVLASVLRQDPDVILVGEVRDNETARMAMQAATTGHLVLTTLHARDTVGTVFRLLDLGVESFLIANSVSMCISQRLVRMLCPHCKRPYRPSARLIRHMHIEQRPHGEFFEAVGCRRCLDVGYHGRMALFEMLVFSPQVRDVILTEPTISDIRKAGGEWMFQTLVESGHRKVIEGMTTVEEVDRVSGIS